MENDVVLVSEYIGRMGGIHDLHSIPKEDILKYADAHAREWYGSLTEAEARLFGSRVLDFVIMMAGAPNTMSAAGEPNTMASAITRTMWSWENNGLSRAMSSGTRATVAFTISDEDIETYAPDGLRELYANLSEAGRSVFCRKLAEDMRDVMEKHPDFGFGQWLRKTLEICEENY